MEPLLRKLIQQLPDYDSQKIYVDLEWQHFDKFTVCNYTFYLLILIQALGQIILMKKALEVSQFNFDERSFAPVQKGLEIVSLALNQHPNVVNKKFPKSFRNGRWGRKGYLHTKFKINGRLL